VVVWVAWNYLSKVWIFKKVDDALGVVYTHGIAGLAGGLLVGVFADPKMIVYFGTGSTANVSYAGAIYGHPGLVWTQLLTALTIIAWDGLVTFVLLRIIKLVIPLRYTDEVLEMLPRVVDQGIASFHDVTCERGLFTPTQATRLLQRSRELGISTKVHADAWQSSDGWRTAVAGGAVSAEHLTYTPDSEIREVGATGTVAVLLPQAELVYMTERRANARLLVEQQVPVAIATDYCSSIHATSLPTTIGIAAPWFSLTPAETIVGATLNAAYALRLQHDRGSIDVGKRGDLTLLAAEHPDELSLAVGQQIVADVIVAGERAARRGVTETTSTVRQP